MAAIEQGKHVLCETPLSENVADKDRLTRGGRVQPHEIDRGAIGGHSAGVATIDPMADLRIGLAGYGNWARSAYLPALRDDGRARVVAVAARSVETRERIAAELGAEVAVFDRFEALIASSALDAVFVALPDGLHEAALTAALDAGLPLLYEPPVADRLDRIRPMLRRLLRAGQVTHADLELSYLPIVARVAELLADEALGELRTAAIRLWGSWDATPDAQLGVIHQLGPVVLGRARSRPGSTPQADSGAEGAGHTGSLPGLRDCQPRLWRPLGPISGQSRGAPAAWRRRLT